MRKIIYLLILAFCIPQSIHAQKEKHVIPKKYKLADYNFVVGTQMIGGKYKFTKDSYLVEQAKQIRSMGSNILKVTLGKNYANAYPDLTSDPTHKSTVDILKSQKEYQKVLGMDFRYIFMWVHSLTGVNWKRPMNAKEKTKLYQEMYDLTEYLLKKYSGTGKTFLIGNWEGDWLLHGLGKRNIEPDAKRIQGMTEWFSIRQAAIDEAKRKVAHQDVNVFYYVEVNLVKKGKEGKTCITESILEKVNPDLVSYSSYEAIKKHPNYGSLKNHLGDLFDYMESKLKPKENIPFERRVFVGEYGYGIISNSLEDQSEMTKQVMMAALELNLPFALHWEMYNNEYTENGKSKGMSLVSEAGVKKPTYYLHSKYYKQMNAYLIKYKKKHKKYPNSATFNAKAVEVLKDL